MALVTAGFCFSAVITALSTVNTGAPFSDHSKLGTNSGANSTRPGSVIPGVAGGGVIGREPKVGGVPAPPGEIAGVGLGVGVVVETSIGVGTGVSEGIGSCPNATNATRNAAKLNPAVRKCFRITG